MPIRLSFTCLGGIAAILALGGCSQTDSLRLLYQGPDNQISASEAETYATNQTDVYKHLITLASVPDPPEGEQWQSVVNAGMLIADEKCDDYLSALFRLNRVRRTTLNQLTLTGATVAAVMGLLEASASAIAITAAAFGYTGATIDNLSNSVLYELEPSTVSNLVHKLQSSYRDGISRAGPSRDRAAAFSVIQNYIRICLPTQIETEVNNAVNSSRAFVALGNAATGQPPAVSTDPQIVRFTLDPASVRIRRVIFPDPSKANLDPQGEERMRRCWADAGVQQNTSVTKFILEPEFAPQREIVAACLGV